MRIYGAATQAAQLQVWHRSAADDRQTNKQSPACHTARRTFACTARSSGCGLATCGRATVKAALERSHERALACTHTLRIRTHAHAALRRRKLRLLRGAAAGGGGWLRWPHIGAGNAAWRGSGAHGCCCALPLDGAAAMHRFVYLLQATTLGAGAAKAAQIRCRATVAARLPCGQRAASTQRGRPTRWHRGAMPTAAHDVASQARQGAAAALIHRGFCAQHHRAAASAPRPSLPPPHPPSPRPDTQRTDPAPHATRTARLRSPHARQSWRLRVAPPRHGLSLPHCSMPPVAGAARRWMDAVRCASARTTSSAPTPSLTPRCRRPDRRSSNGSAMHRCVRRSSRTMSGRSSRTSCARACATTSQSRYG
jgi:hypothetical protein